MGDGKGGVWVSARGEGGGGECRGERGVWVVVVVIMCSMGTTRLGGLFEGGAQPTEEVTTRRPRWALGKGRGRGGSWGCGGRWGSTTGDGGGCCGGRRCGSAVVEASSGVGLPSARVVQCFKGGGRGPAGLVWAPRGWWVSTFEGSGGALTSAWLLP